MAAVFVANVTYPDTMLIIMITAATLNETFAKLNSSNKFQHAIKAT